MLLLSLNATVDIVVVNVEDDEHLLEDGFDIRGHLPYFPTTTMPTSTTMVSPKSSILVTTTSSSSSQPQSTIPEEVCIYFQQLLSSKDSNETVLFDIDDDDLESGMWSVLQLNGPQKHIIEVSLAISSLALLFSFTVYALLPHLRTVPGKCLMGLIFSEFTANMLTFAAFNMITTESDGENTTRMRSQTLCTLIGISLHYMFLTILIWSNLIAFDILKKTRCPTAVLRDTKRYILIAYLSPLIIMFSSLSLDLIITGTIFPQPHSHRPNISKSINSTNLSIVNRTDGHKNETFYGHFVDISLKMFNKIRPRYGEVVCGVNSRWSNFIFIDLPALFSFAFNLIILISAIVKIKLELNAIRHHTPDTLTPIEKIFTSNHRRFFWYLKISVLLGVLNLFSLVVNIFVGRCFIANFFVMLFISSHGTCIFIAFICKRSIFRMLHRHFLGHRGFEPGYSSKFQYSTATNQTNNDNNHHHHSHSRAHYDNRYRNSFQIRSSSTRNSFIQRPTPSILSSASNYHSTWTTGTTAPHILVHQHDYVDQFLVEKVQFPLEENEPNGSNSNPIV